ncbi:hypothetical protein HK102_006681, partial [Quaeritorhiza haematococci]
MVAMSLFPIVGSREISSFLQDNGLRTWVDVDQLMGGVPLFGELRQALAKAAVVLAFVSNDYSLSQNCTREFIFAKEILRLPIIPIAVGDTLEWRKNSDVGFIVGPDLYIDCTRVVKREEILMAVRGLVQVYGRGGKYSKYSKKGIPNPSKGRLVVSNPPPYSTPSDTPSDTPAVTTPTSPILPPYQSETPENLERFDRREPQIWERMLSVKTLKDWLMPVDVEDVYFRLKNQHQKGTRQWLLDEVSQWNNDPSTPVLWLKGQAGMGKSVMASLVVNTLHADNLGAYFFCKHDDNERNDPRRLVNTLAYQLSQRHPVFRERLGRVYREEPDVVERSIPVRFSRLILEILQDLDAALFPKNLVLVLDALDECKPTYRTQLLNVIRTDCSSLPPYVKLFITSRPEKDVELALGRLSCRELKPSDTHNQQDLRIFAKMHLQKYLDEESLPAVVERLVKKSNGLFLWISLVVDAIRNGFMSVHDVHDLPDKLDDMYHRALEEAHRNFNPAILKQVVETIIVLEEPLPVEALEDLVDGAVGKGQVFQAFEALQSLFYTAEDGTVHALHKSLADYLTSKDRCTDPRFYVDQSPTHHRLARRCLSLLLTHLRQKNLCNIPSERALTDLPDLQQRIHTHLPPQVQYACKHFVDHLKKCTPSTEGELKDLLTSVLETKLLFWMETMSVLQTTKAMIPALVAIQQWCDEMAGLYRSEEHQPSSSSSSSNNLSTATSPASSSPSIWENMLS